ncbi:50S ribosomal protein L25 [Flavobacteriales bacterium]|jgi:large subunit ribosomal protein L25|nr:50S ribosomal protein L25 [Flavobacteriales bacterium]
MKTASLSGSSRESVGKKDASQLRLNNRVPAVLYGGGDQKHLSVGELDISKIVVNPDVFQIDLDLDGTAYKCIVQDVQFHPVTERIVHIDLLQIVDGKPVRVELPLRTTGTAQGVIDGGRIQMLFRRLPVRGLIQDLPEEISVDISDLVIGDSARVRDIEVPNCDVLLSESALLVACKRTRAAMSAESEEELEGEGAEGAEGGEGGEAAAE